MSQKTKQQKTISYFNTFESRLGYALLLRGTKHFGYYPPGKKWISMWHAQRLMEDQLAHALRLKPDASVLDAGCGEGKVATYLAKTYKLHITGIDLLEWAVKKAEQNAQKLHVQEKTSFQAMDYTRLLFPDCSFDGVYTMETLVHAPDYRKALKQFIVC